VFDLVCRVQRCARAAGLAWLRTAPGPDAGHVAWFDGHGVVLRLSLSPASHTRRAYAMGPVWAVVYHVSRPDGATVAWPAVPGAVRDVIDEVAALVTAIRS